MSDPARRPVPLERSESKIRLVRILGWTGSALAALMFILAAIALLGHHWMVALALWVVSVVCLLAGWGLAATVWWRKPADPPSQPSAVDVHEPRSSHER